MLAGMRWTVHSEKPLYGDEWLDIRLADVELPDGRHLEHRLIRTPPGAGCVTVKDGQVLLLWRHRFITDTWGWEIPVGKIDPGEAPERALARELAEELGIDACISCMQPLAFASHAYEEFHLLMPLFVCRRWDGLVTPKEGQALKWARPRDLRRFPMPPADAPLIDPLIALLG